MNSSFNAKEAWFYLVLAIVIAGFVLAAGFLVGRAIDVTNKRRNDLQASCQQRQGYWDSYHYICAFSGNK